MVVDCRGSKASVERRVRENVLGNSARRRPSPSGQHERAVVGVAATAECRERGVGLTQQVREGERCCGAAKLQLARAGGGEEEEEASLWERVSWLGESMQAS